MPFLFSFLHLILHLDERFEICVKTDTVCEISCLTMQYAHQMATVGGITTKTNVTSTLHDEKRRFALSGLSTVTREWSVFKISTLENSFTYLHFQPPKHSYHLNEMDEKYFVFFTPEHYRVNCPSVWWCQWKAMKVSLEGEIQMNFNTLGWCSPYRPFSDKNTNRTSNLITRTEH